LALADKGTLKHICGRFSDERLVLITNVTLEKDHATKIATCRKIKMSLAVL